MPSDKDDKPDLITLEQAAKEFGVALISVRRHVKAGLPSYPGDGRRLFVRRTEYREFMARKGQRQQAVKPARPTTADADDPIEAAAKGAPTGDLMAMLERLERQEENAESDFAAARKNGGLSVAEVEGYAKIWRGLAEQRRRVEKEMPEILYRRGRYVDAELVGQMITKAVTGMCAELDQVGIAAADLCVGKSAREIRLEIDQAVRRAREHIQRLLEGLCQPTN